MFVLLHYHFDEVDFFLIHNWLNMVDAVSSMLYVVRGVFSRVARPIFIIFFLWFNLVVVLFWISWSKFDRSNGIFIINTRNIGLIALFSFLKALVFFFVRDFLLLLRLVFFFVGLGLPALLRLFLAFTHFASFLLCMYLCTNCY